MSRYLFPNPGNTVRVANRAFVRLFPETLRLSEDPLFISAATPSSGRQVGLVSGGGSGHEPLHSGFVGSGGLDAAVPGDIFASPHNRQIYAASLAVAKAGGVLHIVKNYTGDLINFGIAAERLAADGIETGRVVVEDDLATGGGSVATGRRGTGGTVIVEKILGAAADTGLPLANLVSLGEEVVQRTRSLAIASHAQTSPATGEAAFELDAAEIEYGVGIHGERAQQSRPRGDLAETIRSMVDELLESIGPDASSVLLLVNGLGSATLLELYGVFDTVTARLDERSIAVEGAMVGTLVAALDMHGFSVTITAAKPGWAAWFQAETGTPAFPRVERPDAVRSVDSRAATSGSSAVDGYGRRDALLDDMAELAREFYPWLTRLDQASGDGDFGDNLTGGLTLAQEYFAKNATSPSGMDAAATVFLNDVGGTSGPLFGLIFQSLARARSESLGDGLTEGLAAVQRVGGAKVGDRTLVDALEPAVRALGNGTLVDAAAAAVGGAGATSELIARRGRASYVGERAVGAPDPGAVGLSLILLAVARSLEPESRDRVAALLADWRTE